jgi:hypothetical protein
VWSTYVFASLLFLFPTVISKYKNNRISTSSYRQSRGALKVALSQLSKSTNDPFDLTSTVLYKYFQSKLYLSSENLDPLIIESVLIDKISHSLLEEIVSLAKICDAGRFGPEAHTQVETLQVQASNLLKKIDRVLI